MDKSNSVWSVVNRLILAACVYYIWQERNRRTHENTVRSPEDIAKLIKTTVKLRLLGLPMSKSVNTMTAVRIWDLICTWWIRVYFLERILAYAEMKITQYMKFRVNHALWGLTKSGLFYRFGWAGIGNFCFLFLTICICIYGWNWDCIYGLGYKGCFDRLIMMGGVLDALIFFSGWFMQNCYHHVLALELINSSNLPTWMRQTFLWNACIMWANTLQPRLISAFIWNITIMLWLYCNCLYAGRVIQWAGCCCAVWNGLGCVWLWRMGVDSCMGLSPLRAGYCCGTTFVQLKTFSVTAAVWNLLSVQGQPCGWMYTAPNVVFCRLIFEKNEANCEAAPPWSCGDKHQGLLNSLLADKHIGLLADKHIGLLRDYSAAYWLKETADKHQNPRPVTISTWIHSAAYWLNGFSFLWLHCYWLSTVWTPKGAVCCCEMAYLNSCLGWDNTSACSCMGWISCMAISWFGCMATGCLLLWLNGCWLSLYWLTDLDVLAEWLLAEWPLAVCWVGCMAISCFGCLATGCLLLWLNGCWLSLYCLTVLDVLAEWLLAEWLLAVCWFGCMAISCFGCMAPSCQLLWLNGCCLSAGWLSALAEWLISIHFWLYYYGLNTEWVLQLAGCGCGLCNFIPCIHCVYRFVWDWNNRYMCSSICRNACYHRLILNADGWVGLAWLLLWSSYLDSCMGQTLLRSVCCWFGYSTTDRAKCCRPSIALSFPGHLYVFPACATPAQLLNETSSNVGINCLLLLLNGINTWELFPFWQFILFKYRSCGRCILGAAYSVSVRQMWEMHTDNQCKAEPIQPYESCTMDSWCTVSYMGNGRYMPNWKQEKVSSYYVNLEYPAISGSWKTHLETVTAVYGWLLWSLQIKTNRNGHGLLSADLINSFDAMYVIQDNIADIFRMVVNLRIGCLVSYFWSPKPVSGDDRGVCPSYVV